MPGPAIPASERPAATSPPGGWVTGLALAVLVALAALGLDFFTYANHLNGPPIRSDGLGYYLYLPAAFLHGDPLMRFLADPQLWDPLGQYPGGVGPDGLIGFHRADGAFLDKYAIGTAVMELPFFLVAWVLRAVRGLASTGFEAEFQYAVCAAGAFYAAAGSYLLFRVVDRMAGRAAAALLVLVAVFATNLVNYASQDASFSHVYSFFLCCCVVALVWREPARSEVTSVGRAAVFALCVALATMVRPTNIVLGLMVFALPWPNWRRAAALWAGMAVLFVLVTLPQTVWWYVTTGSPLSYSYGNEHLDFRHPHLLEFLISVRKGVFFWHPAYLLLLVAAVLAVRYRPRVAGLAVVTVALSYCIAASWDQWWFGGSFGARPAIDTLALLVAGAGTLASGWRPRKWGARLAVGVASLLVVVNLIEAIGYINGAIPIDRSSSSTFIGFWKSVLAIPNGT